MECEAIVTAAANQFSRSVFDVGDVDGGVDVKVVFSSVCGTDHQVFSGDLLYYKNGIAKYPIVTGHEWCGEYAGSPVVGICILGCGDCRKCDRNQPMHCNKRREVGVVNKHGAHAEYICMNEDNLIPIPGIAPKYALIEPLAVCVHALDRLSIAKDDKVLIIGYGSIGRFCGEILKLQGQSFEVYDPGLAWYGYRSEVDPQNFDVILECSGGKRALEPCLKVKGVTILLFGFEYNDIAPSVLSSNEIRMIGTLGSTKDDFKKAVDLMSSLDPHFFEIYPFSDFDQGVQRSQLGKKVVFEH